MCLLHLTPARGVSLTEAAAWRGGAWRDAGVVKGCLLGRVGGGGGA